MLSYLSSQQMAMPCGLLFLMSLVRVAVSSSLPSRSFSCQAFLHTTRTIQSKSVTTYHKFFGADATILAGATAGKKQAAPVPAPIQPPILCALCYEKMHNKLYLIHNFYY